MNIAVLQGQALQQALQRVERNGNSAALWRHLADNGFSPRRDAAAGARVEQPSRGRGYTYVSLPFESASGEAAQLVWDDVTGEPRTAYGLPVREGGELKRVDVHRVVDGSVQRTNSLVRRPDDDIDITDANGHVVQMVPVGPAMRARAAGIAAGANADCSACQVVVDILYGVVACGAVAQYFVCLFVCAAFTAGVGAVICAIACGILCGLVCYVSGNWLRELVCQPWCGLGAEPMAQPA